MNREYGLEADLMKEAVAAAEKHWRCLHEMPEIAFNEYKTTEYIRNAAAQYPVQEIDLGMDTGYVCFLDAGAERTVALRADIDAVPAENGAKHLCGHDAHDATLLGAIHYLSGVSGLPCNVLFIFQPAEEGTRGARALIEHGLFEKSPQLPECIFGIHNRPEVTCGDVVVHRGPLMSEKSVFSITYTGRQGHGSLPHRCIDPVVAGCSFVCSMQTIVSRNTDPFQPVICTVSSIRAGQPNYSAPPETAEMTGYIRSFDHDTHARMEERVAALAESIAKAYECRCECTITPMVPAVCNSDAMYEKACKAVEMAIGREHIKDSAPCLASEDFAVYGKEIPEFFYWVGSGKPGEYNPPWHDPAFRMDPAYMKTAVPVLCASVMAADL